jgi:cellulose biosynthesis protein BcsQ
MIGWTEAMLCIVPPVLECASVRGGRVDGNYDSFMSALSDCYEIVSESVLKPRRPAGPLSKFPLVYSDSSKATVTAGLEILDVYSSKGGVGKTTCCVNLAHASAATGWRTVLWDLDPQGAATYVLEAEQGIKGGIKKLIGGRRELADTVEPTAYEKLDIVPADRSYRNIDVHLHKRKNPAARLMKLMRPLAMDYAAMFLDCAPGMSLVSENIMRAADGLVVPVLPAPLSARMLEQLVAFVDKEGWDDLKLLPFFSMVDRRRTLHRETMATGPCWKSAGE